MMKVTIKSMLLLTLFQRGILSIDLKMVSDTMEALDFKSPLKIQSEMKDRVEFVRYTSLNGKYMNSGKTNLICDMEIDGGFQLVIEDDKNSKLIVLDELVFEEIFGKIQCEINQEVYFLGHNDVFETFIINNQRIARKIGTINPGLKFEWIENRSFLQRRSDFQGIHFKVMFEEFGKFSFLHHDFEHKAPFFENNDTYEVTDFISGVTVDTMNIMKWKLNFTTSHYLRKDRQWGRMIQHANGTLEGIGIVGDIHFNRADIFGARPTINVDRLPFMDYMIPEFFIGIYILETF